MTNVFVSYSRHDKARVEPLVRVIDAAVGEVWWDDRFVAGESFTEETERRLNEADFVVVVWTPNSAHSKWVLDEAAVGRDAGKLIPISLDGQPPPLGFRHVHTLDFSAWGGGADDKCALALKAALLREPVKPAELAVAAKPPVRSATGRHDHHRLRLTIIIGVFAIVGIAMIGGLTMGALTVLGDRDSGEPSIAEVTADLIAGRAPDDPSAAKAKKAVAELGASARAEEKAAFSSFAAGDQEGALEILENLAADLERAGDKKGAAEAYTRAGAIALLVDEGRGLVARRKAFALAPESLLAFQGLFFDTYLTQGFDASTAFANDIIAGPASDRMRGVAYAHIAITALGDLPDLEIARSNLARVAALRDRSDDPYLQAAAVWVSSVIDWREDRLDAAEEKAAAFDRIAADLDEPVFEAGPDVAFVRHKFAAGDWKATFEQGARRLEERRKSGHLIPAPILNGTCLAGLYTEQVESAAPYCEALLGRSDYTGGAGMRIYSAELAAARGDFAVARREIDASRALNADDPYLAAERVRVEAAIAAGEGDLDAAQELVWRYADMVADDPAFRSKRATILRLFGLWAIRAGAADRACDPLKDSGALYAAIGGAAGAEATSVLRAEAGCA